MSRSILSSTGATGVVMIVTDLISGVTDMNSTSTNIITSDKIRMLPQTSELLTLGSLTTRGLGMAFIALSISLMILTYVKRKNVDEP